VQLLLLLLLSLGLGLGLGMSLSLSLGLGLSLSLSLSLSLRLRLSFSLGLGLGLCLNLSLNVSLSLNLGLNLSLRGTTLLGDDEVPFHGLELGGLPGQGDGGLGPLVRLDGLLLGPLGEAGGAHRGGSISTSTSTSTGTILKGLAGGLAEVGNGGTARHHLGGNVDGRHRLGGLDHLGLLEERIGNIDLGLRRWLAGRVGGGSSGRGCSHNRRPTRASIVELACRPRSRRRRRRPDIRCAWLGHRHGSGGGGGGSASSWT